MHPTVYSAFRTIVAELNPRGRVLEVGALPDKRALLAMPELSDCERIGINLAPPSRNDGFEVIQGNGNQMSMFADNSFDLVLSNATLEHDQRFWLTCAEIRRVTKIDGFAVIGVPAFDASTDVVNLGIPRPDGIDAEAWNVCTLTFRYHGAPFDYYRFTERAMREIFFEGFVDFSYRTIMVPPRMIGFGAKAHR
jgi:SAM-dependent methyltransferase